MNLKEYEQAKFELAELLRSAAVASGIPLSAVPDQFRELFARLAEDRFNLVVVGRFNRGKSSIMNALLDTDRLPTGIVPLTSVITTVRYGTHELVSIQYQGSHLTSEISLAQLPDYITQAGNPGNERRIAVAEIRLPAELLRRGFFLVDTPGLGSSIVENTRTTENFLPEADAFMLVTSYDSPLSDEELRLLQRIVPSARKVFLVLNKSDIATAGERTQVERYVSEKMQREFGPAAPAIFSTSAQIALEGRKRTDADSLRASGVAALRNELVRFLIAEKQIRFLSRMCERVGGVVAELPNATAAVAQLQSLRRKYIGGRDDKTPASIAATAVTPGVGVPFRHCEVCDRVANAMFDVLSKYQYDLVIDEKHRTALAERGGLCEFHTWQYGGMASPRGTCIGFSMVAERLAEALRSIASGDAREIPLAARIAALRPTKNSCFLCLAQSRAEHAALEAARSRLATVKRGQSQDLPDLCVPHLCRLASIVEDSDLIGKLIVREAAILERVAEDMRRYALKFDGARRFLASAEEEAAARIILNLLAGNANVNTAGKPD